MPTTYTNTWAQTVAEHRSLSQHTCSEVKPIMALYSNHVYFLTSVFVKIQTLAKGYSPNL